MTHIPPFCSIKQVVSVWYTFGNTTRLSLEINIFLAKKKLDSYGTFVVTYIVMLKDNIMILNDDIIITEPTDEELAEIESELSDIINDDSDDLD